MNKVLVKKYMIAGLLYLLEVSIFTLYAQIRHGVGNDYLLGNLEYALGYSGYILAGLFLFSKSLKRWHLDLSHMVGFIEELEKIGLASCMTFGTLYLLFFSYQIYNFFLTNLWLFGLTSIVLIIGFTFVVSYSKKLIESRFSGSGSNIKCWTVFTALLIFLFVTILDKLNNWITWFQYIFGPPGSTNNSVLPQPSLIVAIYMLVVILLYIWEIISQRGVPDINKTATPAPPTSPQVPIQTAPPPSSPDTPINSQTG